MYPAQGLADERYFDQDLPTALTFKLYDADGVLQHTLNASKSGTGLSVSYPSDSTVSGYTITLQYGNDSYTEGTPLWYVTPDAGSVAGANSGPCLVAEFNIDGDAGQWRVVVEDQFPDILQADWTPAAPEANADSAVLTRVGLCQWEGISTVYGASVVLGYEDVYWFINITWPTEVPGYPYSYPRGGGSSRENVSVGGDGQSTPLGNFENLGGWDYTPADGGPVVIT
jgi:hypothetical protein